MFKKYTFKIFLILFLSFIAINARSEQLNLMGPYWSTDCNDINASTQRFYQDGDAVYQNYYGGGGLIFKNQVNRIFQLESNKWKLVYKKFKDAPQEPYDILYVNPNYIQLFESSDGQSMIVKNGTQRYNQCQENSVISQKYSPQSRQALNNPTSSTSVPQTTNITTPSTQSNNRIFNYPAFPSLKIDSRTCEERSPPEPKIGIECQCEACSYCDNYKVNSSEYGVWSRCKPVSIWIQERKKEEQEAENERKMAPLREAAEARRQAQIKKMCPGYFAAKKTCATANYLNRCMAIQLNVNESDLNSLQMHCDVAGYLNDNFGR
jgi:hypothetical protein